MSIVKTEKLCKYYNQGTVNITALNNCSISIEKGEFIAVTGPSGSGKSTLLNICGGLDKPDSGEVYIDGVELGSRSSDELQLFEEGYRLCISKLSADPILLLMKILFACTLNAEDIRAI